MILLPQFKKKTHQNGDNKLYLPCGKCKDLEITIGYGSHFFYPSNCFGSFLYILPHFLTCGRQYGNFKSAATETERKDDS